MRGETCWAEHRHWDFGPSLHGRQSRSQQQDSVCRPAASHTPAGAQHPALTCATEPRTAGKRGPTSQSRRPALGTAISGHILSPTACLKDGIHLCKKFLKRALKFHTKCSAHWEDKNTYGTVEWKNKPATVHLTTHE